MADLAAGDLTYVVVGKQRKEDSGNKVINFTVAFGDSALTYPANGIPLSSAKLGVPNSIIALVIDSPASGDGILYKYDKANNKIRLYRAPSHTHSLHLNQADVVDSAGSRVNAGTNLLGSNTGADIAIAGVANTSGAGGIVNVAQGSLTEVASGSYAPAATTLYIQVTGY